MRQCVWPRNSSVVCDTDLIDHAKTLERGLRYPTVVGKSEYILGGDTSHGATSDMREVIGFEDRVSTWQDRKDGRSSGRQKHKQRERSVSADEIRHSRACVAGECMRGGHACPFVVPCRTRV